MNGYLRLKQISSLLQLSTGETQKLFTYKHRKKLYSHFDSTWYEFKNMKDVIVPISQVQKMVMTSSNVHPIVKGLSPKVKSQFANLMQRLTRFCKEPCIDSSSGPKKIIPVIAILGHYDHGKTTLLDALGGTNHLSSDFNGVTQSVRTQLVPLHVSSSTTLSSAHLSTAIPPSVDSSSSPSSDSSKYWVTFVDTPGQEFFYRMRNFGASVADAALLVVSAQEGVCLQTEESIGIVESMNIPVIVAINKIDTLSDKDAEERINQLKSQLSEYTALSRALFVPVSALKNINLDQLQQVLLRVFHQKTCSEDSVGFNAPVFEWPSHYFGHINNNNNNNNTRGSVAGTTSIQDGKELDHVNKSCKSKGTLLNLWKNKVDGTALHVLLGHGTVSGIIICVFTLIESMYLDSLYIYITSL